MPFYLNNLALCYRIPLQLHTLASPSQVLRKLGQAQPELVHIRLFDVRWRVHPAHHVSEHERLCDARDSANALAELYRGEPADGQ